jgi:hypothetical protein
MDDSNRKVIEEGEISDDDWSGVFTQENPEPKVSVPDIGMSADGIPFELKRKGKKKKKKKKRKKEGCQFGIPSKKSKGNYFVFCYSIVFVIV